MPCYLMPSLLRPYVLGRRERLAVTITDAARHPKRDVFDQSYRSLVPFKLACEDLQHSWGGISHLVPWSGVPNISTYSAEKVACLIVTHNLSIAV